MDIQKVKNMTAKDKDQYTQDLEQFEQWRKDEENKAKLKAATLAKLGLTEEEIAALMS